MRLIDADKIEYMWKQDRNGKFRDGVTLESIVNDMPAVNVNDLIIKELEELKVKVIALSYDCKIATIDRYEVEKLIDRQIAELKGDNSQSRCNNCIYNDTEGLSGECYACVKGIEDWYEPLRRIKNERY